jgi:hypothetical protein
LLPRCWRTATTGEIASLAGAADDPRYFQVLADGHHAAGQFVLALVDARGNVKGSVPSIDKFFHAGLLP